LGSGNTFENNIVQHNIIYENQGVGIELSGGTRNNLIQYNNISNHNNYAIQAFSDSSNNSIMENSFFNNHPGSSSQAYDDGIGNVFLSNFWSDWTSPDNDGDGIVDQPYAIDGSASNNDPMPKAGPKPHTLTGLTIIYPNGGEILQGVVTIEWDPAIDSLGHNVSYSIYFSTDNGATWYLIVTNITTTTFTWNTSTVIDGTNYLLKIEAEDGYGLSLIDLTDDSFEIANNIFLTDPIVIYPNGGEVLSGIITIQWSQASGLSGHSIRYDLYYSPDSGNSWFIITGFIPDTFYSWNTKLVEDGSNYMIKVVAVDLDSDLKASDISDATFSINNNIDSSSINEHPQLINSTNGWSIVTIILSFNSLYILNHWWLRKRRNR